MPAFGDSKNKVCFTPRPNSNSNIQFTATNSRLAGLPTECQFCRSENLEIKPHHYHPAQVRCCSCGRWIKFLSKDLVAAIGFEPEPETAPQQTELDFGGVA